MAAFCFSNTRILFACPVVLHGEVGRFRIQRSYVVNQMLSKTMYILYLNVRESFILCDIETRESLLLEGSSKFLPPTCSPLLSCSCLFPISCSPSPPLLQRRRDQDHEAAADTKQEEEEGSFERGRQEFRVDGRWRTEHQVVGCCLFHTWAETNHHLGECPPHRIHVPHCQTCGSE